MECAMVSPEFTYIYIHILGMSRYQKKAVSPIRYIGADIKK